MFYEKSFVSAQLIYSHGYIQFYSPLDNFFFTILWAQAP